MRIVIVGAGFTGTMLARTLTNGTNGTANTVTLIDNDEETVRHASNRLDCAVVCADGNDLTVLEDAGIAKADALVCVTESDEVNMITCSLVDAVYPGITKIARVRNYAYYVNTAQAQLSHASEIGGTHRPLYGIDWMIHSDVEAAEAIVQAVRHGAAGDVLAFDESDYVLTRVLVSDGSALCHKKLMAVRSLCDARFLIAYMENGADTEDSETVLPSGNTVITSGCVLGIVARKSDTAKVLKLCGTEQKELRNIVIVGAGRIGTIVAEQLLKKETYAKSAPQNWFSRLFNHAKPKAERNIVMIDSDEKLAAAAAEKFDKIARVFCADATDESFLSEEGITSFDLAICATHNHEMNMVLAAYLESLGVGQSVSLVESSAFASIARKLGVDVAVPLRDSIVDNIISHLRGTSVKEVHTVASGDLEIIECVVSQNSAVIGKTLKELARPGVFLLMLVRHKNAAMYEIPIGDTLLNGDDSCILIVQSSHSAEVLSMFGGTK